MLFVKTYIASSEISGIGLFAKEFIPKGTRIWKFVPGLDVMIDEKVYNSYREEIFFEDLDKYAYKSELSGFHFYCVDDAKFMNHSEDSNTFEENSDFGSTVAKRDIHVGEEITCNYKTFYADIERCSFIK